MRSFKSDSTKNFYTKFEELKHNKKLPVVIATHDGSYHADDVMACAVVSMWLDRNGFSWRIVRTRDTQEINSAHIVIDVGSVHDVDLLRFDHHQAGGAGFRPNKIPYASFGLVWDVFGIDLCEGSEEMVQTIDREMVQAVDAIDMGVTVSDSRYEGLREFSFAALFSSYLPTWKEDVDVDQLFMQVVGLARDFIERTIKVWLDRIEAQSRMIACYKRAKDKRIIELDEPYGWVYVKEFFREYKDVYFVISPKKGGSRWSVKALTKTDYDSRIPFPQQWAGLRDKELQARTGVKDALFCHNRQYMCVTCTKEAAYALARKTIALHTQ